LPDVTFDPAEFSGTVPVFPLPNVVLFPGNALPLHIFEPRYREMTRTALAGERLIAMGLLKDDWESLPVDEPPFHPVLGLGKIIEDVRLDDGRFNLLLFGVARVRLLELLPTDDAFRTARVEILRDLVAEDAALERRRKLLFAFYVQMIRELSKGQMTAPPRDLPLGLLCDLVTSLLGLPAGVKQEMLGQSDVALRSERLLALLKTLDGTDPASGPRKWPPEASPN
jgi:Lon protease-like protein